MPLKLEPVERDLGEFSVRRYLPNPKKRCIGPFVFFDHMGPADFPAGSGIDVRPHPHIGLATLTYLFEGSILHRDSLGSVQEISPGEVNWMTAGRGIVHSERESVEVRAAAHRANGLQVWLALPPHLAEIEPDFQHVSREQLPHRIEPGIVARVVAGTAWGLVSPVKVYSPTIYIDLLGEPGARLDLPAEAVELAAYVQSGSVAVAGETIAAGEFVLLDPASTTLEVLEPSRVILLGGEPFDRDPYLNWNFVSFRRERIDQARDDWQAGRFPKVPGDDREHIPLPDD